MSARLLIDKSLKSADWPKRTPDQFGQIGESRTDEFCEHGSLTAACHSAACRPPQSGGTGGSLPQRGSGTPPEVGQIQPEFTSYEPTGRLESKMGRALGKAVVAAAAKAGITLPEGDMETTRWVEMQNRRVAKQMATEAVTKPMLKDPAYKKWATEVLDTEIDTSAATFEQKYGLYSNIIFAALKQGGMGLLPERMKIGELIDRYQKHVLKQDGVDVSEATSPYEFITRSVVENAINRWADTSGDSDDTAIAFQLAAARVHGIGTSTMKAYTDEITLNRANKRLAGDDSIAYEAVIRAEYAATQKFLKSAGITELVIYRGMGVPDGTALPAVGDNVSLQQNPTSAWSTGRRVANGFALSQVVAYPATVLAMKVPASEIQSLPITGRGCLPEFEVLLIGGSSTAAVIESYKQNGQT